jgi:hypothetical protein
MPHTMEVGRHFKMKQNERKQYHRPSPYPISGLLDQSLLVNSN